MIGYRTGMAGRSGPIARAVMQAIRLQSIADQDATPADFGRTWPVLAHLTNASYNAHLHQVRREESIKGRAAA